MEITTPGLKRLAPFAVTAALVALPLLAPETSGNRLQAFAAFFFAHFDWLTLVVAGAAVVFCVLALLPSVARRRIGGPEARPEFRTVTWLAMLFATGMGAGLVFWGAAEPLIFTLSPPPGGAEPGSAEAREEALALTQFHWGLHAWAVYAAAALAVAVASTGGRPPLPSTVFNWHGKPVGRVLDWTALFAIVFGIVASLGQGVFQLAAGVERIGGTAPLGRWAQSGLLLVLAAAFMFSTARGLRGSIARLSNINLVVALGLSLVVLLLGPTADIIATGVETVQATLARLPSLSLELREVGPARQWTRNWSLTYFLWWIAWTPFVGVFVARISRGRRIGTFVAGVLGMPVALTLIWFSIFGGTALSLTEGGLDLGVASFETAPQATYAVLEALPLPTLTRTTAFLLVFLFLLTSADSAAYVLALFSSGRSEPPVPERLFWGGAITLLTLAAILGEGGQSVTRAFAVTGAIPLMLLLLAQMGMTLARRYRPPAPTERSV